MLGLDSASRLQLTASVAGSLDYIVTKVRNAAPNIAIVTKGNKADAAASDICVAPGGTDVDTVASCSINNKGVLTDIIVESVGGVTVRAWKVKNFAPDEWFVWNDQGTPFVLTADGRVKSDGASPYDIKGTAVASAATVILGAGSYFHITGTVGITDIDFADPWDGRSARLVFDGKLLLTHNATSLVLPGKQNITTAPGDSAIIVQDSGDNIIVLVYERVAGTPNVNPFNAQIANQTPAASATTLLSDTVAPIPDSGVQIRSRFLWHVVASKTAAGTVAPIFLSKIGPNGTTADPTVLTFTFPAVGTAAADVLDAWIEMVIVGPLTGVCVVRGVMLVQRTLGNGATGWYTVAGMLRIIGTPATFDATVASLKASLSITLGAGYVVTIEHASVETNNL